MPTLRTVTVKSSGGDYTSLSAAEAGEQGNLVTLDRQLDIECYASAAGDSTAVRIDGWTTDATRYIRVVCPAGERHAGAWDTSKYHLTGSTSGTGGMLYPVEDHTRIEYLQIRNTNGSPGDFDCAIYGDGGPFRVDGCICRGGKQTIWAPIGNCDVWNTIAYGGQIGLWITGSTAGAGRPHNCTVVGSVYGLRTTTANSVGPQPKNVYAHGGTKGIFGDGVDGGFCDRVNCMSSDTSATATGGGSATNCTGNVGHNTTNFTNVTGGSEDYRLPSGSALIDAGVDLSGTFTNDIDGTTRPQNSVFDVGADEYVAAGGGGSSFKFLVRRYGGQSFMVRAALVN